MRKIELLFYRTNPSPENTGLKQVLFKVTETKGEVLHDFGYCDWTGTEWELPPVDEGMSIEVHSWANNPDPAVLLKEESKIIRLNP